MGCDGYMTLVIHWSLVLVSISVRYENERVDGLMGMQCNGYVMDGCVI